MMNYMYIDVIPYDESQLDGIVDGIREKLGQLLTNTGSRGIHPGMWFRIEGPNAEIERAAKVIRRLGRGKMKFRSENTTASDSFVEGRGFHERCVLREDVRLRREISKVKFEMVP